MTSSDDANIDKEEVKIIDQLIEKCQNEEKEQNKLEELLEQPKEKKERKESGGIHMVYKNPSDNSDGEAEGEAEQLKGQYENKIV